MTAPGNTDERGLEDGLPMKVPEETEDLGQRFQSPRGTGNSKSLTLPGGGVDGGAGAKS